MTGEITLDDICIVTIVTGELALDDMCMVSNYCNRRTNIRLHLYGK